MMGMCDRCGWEVDSRFCPDCGSRVRPDQAHSSDGDDTDDLTPTSTSGDFGWTSRSSTSKWLASRSMGEWIIVVAIIVVLIFVASRAISHRSYEPPPLTDEQVCLRVLNFAAATEQTTIGEAVVLTHELYEDTQRAESTTIRTAGQRLQSGGTSEVVSAVERLYELACN